MASLARNPRASGPAGSGTCACRRGRTGARPAAREGIDVHRAEALAGPAGGGVVRVAGDPEGPQPVPPGQRKEQPAGPLGVGVPPRRRIDVIAEVPVIPLDRRRRPRHAGSARRRCEPAAAASARRARGGATSRSSTPAPGPWPGRRARGRGARRRGSGSGPRASPATRPARPRIVSGCRQASSNSSAQRCCGGTSSSSPSTSGPGVEEPKRGRRGDGMARCVEIDRPALKRRVQEQGERMENAGVAAVHDACAQAERKRPARRTCR